MASRVVVRKASEGDIEKVSSLIARLKMLNSELDPHFVPVDNLGEVAAEYVKETLSRSDALILVAEDEVEGRIAGILRLEVVDRRFYKPRVKAVVTDLYVHPLYRGKHVGRLLIERAMEEARRLGAGIITVVYPNGNIIAGAFYSKMGFREFQKELYKPL